MYYALRNIVLFVFCISSCLAIQAQNTKRVSATYTYYAPENVTLEEARFTALERAKLQAIADEFGTIVTQNNITRTESKNGEVSTDFTSLGESMVKGEWMETIGTPEITISYEQNMLVVKCTVKGRAREIKTTQVNFVAKVLCNGTEKQFERDEFKDGDRLYLSFQTPKDGYVAVYLIDAEKNANCLLPYPSNAEGQVKVKHGMEYIFFSAKHEPTGNFASVEEYALFCEDKSELNQIYVIFSPNPFTKAVDRGGDNNVPRFLPLGQFQEWLSKCRKQDAQMSLEVKNIYVKK